MASVATRFAFQERWFLRHGFEGSPAGSLGNEPFPGYVPNLVPTPPPIPLFPLSVSFLAAGSHLKLSLLRAEHSFKILRQPIEPDLPAGLLSANNIGQSPWHFLP